METKMRNLFSKISRKAKSFVIGMVTMGMFLPLMLPGIGGSVYADGPIFNNHPNDYATLRVANNNDPGNFSTSVQANPGDQLIYSIYVHNNVVGTTATNTAVKAALDSEVATAHGAVAAVWAANASAVTGNAVVYTNNIPTKIEYVPNSAYRFVTGTSGWEPMPDGVLGSGLVLGDVQGCFEYVQQVIFRANVVAVQPQKATLTLNKQVALKTSGGSAMAENVSAKNGDQVVFGLTITNNSGVQANNVRVSDQLPSGLEYVANSTTLNGGAAGEGITSSGIAIGNLAAGATATVSFYANVTANTASTITLTNTGAAMADNADPVQDTASVTVSVVPTKATLTLNKQVALKTSGGSAMAENVSAKNGDQVVFGLTITNNSGVQANNVRVSDQLPSGLEYVANSTTFNGAAAGEGITSSGIAIGNLAAGATATVSFYANVTANTASTITLTNTGAAMADNADPVQDTASVTIQINGQAGLTIAKTVSLGDGTNNFVESVNANNNDIVRFKLVVTSTGDTAADNVVISDVLPSGLSYIDNTTYLDNVLQSGNNAIVNSGINVNSLTKNTVRTIIFNSRVTVSNTTLTNTGYVKASNVNQISDTANVVIGGPVSNRTYLSLAKTVALDGSDSYNESVSVRQNDVVKFRLVIANTGNNNATNVLATDQLPSGLEYIAGSTTRLDVTGTRTIDNGITSNGVNLGTIVSSNNAQTGAITTVTLTFRARVTTSSTTPLTNTGATMADNADPVQDTASVSIQGNGGNAYLTVTKDVDKSTANPGDELRYTIRIRNTGNSDSTNIRVVDELPSRVDYVSGSISTSGDGSVTYSSELFDDGLRIDRLRSGNEAVIRFTARIYTDASSGMRLENTVVVRDDQGNRAEDDAVTTLNSDRGYLSISKSVDKSTANAGDELKYTIRVRNTGDGDVTNIRVYDELPSYLTYVSGSISVQGDYITSEDLFGSGVRASRLREDADITITFRARINNNISSQVTIENVARVTADDGLNDRAIATTTVGYITGDTTISVVKLVRNDTTGESTFNVTNSANPGNVMEYKITVTNNGNSHLSNIKLSDTLPTEMSYLGGTAKAWFNSSVLSGDWNNVVNGGAILPEMNPGDVYVLMFKAKSKSDLANQTTVTNYANITANSGISQQSTAKTLFTTAQAQVAPMATSGGGSLPSTGPGGAMALIMFFGTSSLVWFVREKWLLAKMF